MGGKRPESGTGVLLSAEETREVLGRLGGGAATFLRRSGGGRQTNGDGEDGSPPPVTREAGPGTPLEDQGTQAAETVMVKLSVTALEGGVTPLDTPEQKYSSLPLPSGGGGEASLDTLGQQHGGPSVSNIAVVGGTR